MALSISGSSPSFTTYQGGVVTSGTAQASTSGTSIDFTSIPSWVKRITVMFNGVSTSGTSFVQVQIGSGSVSTSGYVNAASQTTTTQSNYATTGFVTVGTAASLNRWGHMVLTLVSGNIWAASHTLGYYDGSTAYTSTGGGVITLGGALDRVRVTTVNGTDTFDAGSLNILYE